MAFLRFAGTAAAATEPLFIEASEKDYPLRSLSVLKVSNLRGSVAVEGWAQDRIRVRITKKVMSGASPLWGNLLNSTSVIHVHSEGIGQTEESVRVEYGKGLSFQDRLKEREIRDIITDIQVLAPRKLGLQVWSGDRVQVKNWRGSIDLFANQGVVNVSDVVNDRTGIQCGGCEVDLKEITAQDLKVIGASHGIKARGLLGGALLLDSEDGAVDLEKVKGKLWVSTGSGDVKGSGFEGSLELKSASGAVSLGGVKGQLNVRSELGQIRVELEPLEEGPRFFGLSSSFFGFSTTDRGSVESGKGDVALSLTDQADTEISIFQDQGTPFVNGLKGFQLKKTENSIKPIEWKFRMGSGKETFRVGSNKGSVQITRLQKFF